MSEPLALYGHLFSSYTWKAQIALHALELDYEFRILATENPDSCPNWQFVRAAGPQGQFPVLTSGSETLFESTSIIEWLDLHFGGDRPLIPEDRRLAIDVRLMDRVFDNAVMNVMQRSVWEHLFRRGGPDPDVVADVRQRLRRSYDWLERWLVGYESERITLIECAAAPSLFYADWVEQITELWPRLKAWRGELNARPEVNQCIEAARPYRANFPLGAPDRD